MPRRNNHRRLPKRRVLFKLEAPEARDVVLCASVSRWDGRTRRLKRDRKGTWKTTLMLEPGSYEYHYVVDGERHIDPDGEGAASHEYGSCSVRIVP